MTQRPSYRDPELSPEARTRDLMQRMTIEQMVGQLVQADGRQDAESQVIGERVGSFLHILGAKTVELQRLADQTPLAIPLIFGIDAIHGHGFWPGATVFPTQLALSCSWNPQLLEMQGRVTAREMLCTGLHWTFSPVLCLTRDLRWGRVGETFGEDPYLIGEFAKALVRGLQGDNLSSPHSVLACAKHYAGYSETVGGRDATEAELSERKLRSYFLPPFEQVARAGCRTFMTAYQCIDGVSCVVNHWLLTEVLRQEWGFDGFVVTDWDNVGRTHRQQALYPSVEAAIPDSIRAGNDMIMVTPEFYQGALSCLRKGTLGREDVEQACRRILHQKFELGLFDHKRYPQLDRAPEVIGCREHREPLLQCALESIVLLENRSHGAHPTLPLSGSIKRIAVLGPNADNPLAQLGDWSFGSGQAELDTGGHPRETVCTVLDGVRQRAARSGIAVDYAPGCEIMNDDLSQIARATQLATAADVAVVVVGDDLPLIGEECDRSELELRGGQLPLLQAIKDTSTPMVVVLINSKPLCIPWVAANADAVLEAFNPGMAGGEAIAALLFGDAVPCGKLTVSFPRSIGEQPVYYQQIPGWHGSKHGTYDPTPLYPFGYGLSFTRFEYRNLRISPARAKPNQTVRIEAEVANVGDRAGVEIAQLYLNDVFTSLSTPEKTLKRFARVPLQPGETKTLSFELNSNDWAFAGKDGRPIIEPGEFVVMLGGSSSSDALLKDSFELLE